VSLYATHDAANRIPAVEVRRDLERIVVEAWASDGGDKGLVRLGRQVARELCHLFALLELDERKAA
jgi:hypothetical protein